MLHGCRILLTGVGAPGTRGTLYALANNPDRVPVSVLGVDARAEAVGRHWGEGFRQVPLPGTPAYADTMVELCARESIDLVIPQTTRETAALAELHGRFAALGIQVMVAGPAAVRRANDKGALLELFERLRLPHPAYHRTASEEELRAGARQLGYPERPVAVKPAVSNGMRGFRVLKERAWDVHRFLSEKPSGIEIALDELVAILRRGKSWPELLVTEYLPGPEYSVDAFAGRRGAVAVPRLRKAVLGGISFDTVLEERADLAQYTLSAAAALGLRYAFGFQFKLDAAGVPKLLECNPRVQGTMVAGIFGGINVIWLAVREALDDPPVPPAPGPLPRASFRRFWGGLGIAEGRVHEI